MSNESIGKKILNILMYVFYFTLLFWPFFVLLGYIFFKSPVREMVGPILMAVETILGAFTLWTTIQKEKEKNTTGSKILKWVVLITYIYFIGHAVYMLIWPS